MLKNLYSILVLSTGLIVGIGANSNTVAPDTELSIQRHNSPSDHAALTDKSQSKIKPYFSGRNAAYGGNTSLLQNHTGIHDWFPSPHLSDAAEIVPVFFGSAGNHNSTLTLAGGFGGFSSSEGYSISGSRQGFPSGINNPGLPLDYGYAKVSSKDSSSGTITGKEQVPVPEPGTLVMVGSGLLILCYKVLRNYL